MKSNKISNIKFSLIFPLPSSKNWKNGLTAKEINKIIRDNNQKLKEIS